MHAFRFAKEYLAFNLLETSTPLHPQLNFTMSS